MAPGETTTQPEMARRGGLAVGAVWLAAAWILAGGLFKLLAGSPADLPQVVLGLQDDVGLTYRLVIAIELVTVALALVRPAWGWLPVAGAYLVFEAVLISQLKAGEESCGCFGQDSPITPGMMMAIDTALLVLLLASRPWRIRNLGGPLWLAGLLMAVGAALPWVVNREVKVPAGGSGDGGGAADPAPEGFANLDVEKWVGQSIYDTTLAVALGDEIYNLPPDGLWILWRWDCSHCAEHLAELADNPPDAPFVVLVRLEQGHDTEANREVFAMPGGENVVEASCPDTMDYICQTPAELVLEGGVVVSAAEGVGAED